MSTISRLRTRWAAIGAAVAVTLGAGGIGITHATLDSGERTAFVPITPCRLADTRPAPFNVGPRLDPIGAAGTFTIDAWGSVGNCNLTDQATGLVLNVTAVNQTQITFLTIYPTGSTRPETSNLNPSPGQPPTPNSVTVDLNSSGQFSIYNLQGSVDVIVDVVGYYEDHNHDDRYFTEAEADARFAASVHAHDDRYFTETESDARYSPKAPAPVTVTGQQFIASPTGGVTATCTATPQYFLQYTTIAAGVHSVWVERAAAPVAFFSVSGVQVINIDITGSTATEHFTIRDVATSSSTVWDVWVTTTGGCRFSISRVDT